MAQTPDCGHHAFAVLRWAHFWCLLVSQPTCSARSWLVCTAPLYKSSAARENLYSSISFDSKSWCPTQASQGAYRHAQATGRKSKGVVCMWKLNLWAGYYRARYRLYRNQMLQENTRWKALDEIYKIYMLLHRSDLNISANFHRFFLAFSIRNAKKFDFFQISSWFSLILMRFARIFLDVLEKRCNYSKFLESNSMLSWSHLIFDLL